MERNENTVRIWVGLDLLQAQLMKQTLLDNGIECFADHDIEMLPAASLGEVGLWVGKDDERQARALLEELEETMSEALDAEGTTPDNET